MPATEFRSVAVIAIAVLCTLDRDITVGSALGDDLEPHGTCAAKVGRLEPACGWLLSCLLNHARASPGRINFNFH